MREATPQEVAKFTATKRFFDSQVTKAVERAIVVCEFAANVQLWLDNRELDLQCFSAARYDRITKLIDGYNRISRSLSAVELGRYGIRFTEDDFDVLAPPPITEEEITPDKWIGLEGIPILVVAIGALVVAAVWGVARIIDARAKTIEEETTQDIVKIDAHMAKAPPDVLQAWKDLKRQNRKKLTQVGLFDRLFGDGSGALALGIGGAIVAIMLLSKRRG